MIKIPLQRNADASTMSAHSDNKYHLLAFIVILIWGTTFVSTKVLINNGLTAVDIFLCRFLLAYIGIWVISPKKLFADSLKDELLLLGLGITGGSLYFLTENFALSYSLASNVSLIVCSTPIFTSILLGIVSKDERMNRKQILGSLLAFIGMGLVVLNGHFVLKLSPLGDALAFAAAWSWAFYSLLMKKLSGKYSSRFISRKVFFYGLITALPMMLYKGLNLSFDILTRPTILFNLLFLGLIASLLCYVAWSVVMINIGFVRASNYIYLNPVITVIAAVIFVNERITVFALLGMALILIGLLIAEKKRH